MTVNGYECKTTFWDDFTIAEHFGVGGILDTYERAFEAWKEDTEYITEFVMILNWKCWDWYERGKSAVSKLYSDLYYKAHEWCLDNLKGEALDYYLRTTD